MGGRAVEPRTRNEEFGPEHAILFAGAAMFLSILAPFGTATDLTISFRLLYWFAVVFGGTAITVTSSILIQRLVRTRTTSGVMIAVSMQVLIASIPITLLVAGMEMWLRNPIGWFQLPQIYPYVVSIVAVITTASLFTKRHRVLRNQLADTQTRNETRTNTRFHLRLPPRLRHKEITMLKAEDHYLRVCMGEDTEVIRCSLSVAIDELDSVDGQRVHRSFWVARSAIQSTERYGNAYRLVMNCGQTVPLSRRRYSELSRRAWLPI